MNTLNFNPHQTVLLDMLTLIIAFLFTTLAFALFLYYFVWHNRFSTKIRLAIHEKGARIICIKRIVQTQNNPRRENYPEVTVNRVEWQVIYKDKFENFHETRCRIINDQLHWTPPLL